jgi:transcriptional regulator
VYVDHPSVPTWNYVVVHARGRATLLDELGLGSVIDDLVARFDASDWRLDESPDFLGPMMGAIAGFEIAIESLEGKWKLSQNRTPEERARVAAWLERGDSSSREAAALMRHHLKLTSSE